MEGEKQCNNNLSGIRLLNMPWKAWWKEKLQPAPPGGTGMLHDDNPWQLISSTQEVIVPFQQPS